MHLVNRALSILGLKLSRAKDSPVLPSDFARLYRAQLNLLKQNARGFHIIEEPRYDVGQHPRSYVDHECSFAADHLARRKPESILDIGSYRHFILGLLAGYKITTLDVRAREAESDNETVLTGDAKQLALPSDSFDAIVSLCAIEHFGLGRYGDEFDLDADANAFREMIRVLKPGGILVFSTTITRGAATIEFNAHRIYSLAMLHEFCANLECCEEKFFSQRLGDWCELPDVTDMATWDVYCGCWAKP